MAISLSYITPLPPSSCACPLRQVRVVAYSQFLESYKSVTLESMALSFGVGAPFLDAELSAFIAAGRLNCKVDKVAGVVETNRPDAKKHREQRKRLLALSRPAVATSPGPNVF